METEHISKMEELKLQHSQTMKLEMERLNMEADVELEKMVEDMTNRHKAK